MDSVDRAIINRLQGGFPVCARPYAAAAAGIGLSERELITRLERLVADGLLSRFGPMYRAEALGGAVTLCAMSVPEGDFDRVADGINRYPEVAHNYAREHELNMWFVVASESPARVGEVIDEIEAAFGLRVHDLPKLDEYFVGLELRV